MISRYDAMQPSLTATDPIDHEVYADVLSVNYSSFTYNQPPYIYQPDYQFSQYPYVVTNAFYNVAAYDDVVLMINKVPHISLVLGTDNTVPEVNPANGTVTVSTTDFPTLNFPVLSDLRAFMKKPN